jgi:hypothetical protein
VLGARRRQCLAPQPLLLAAPAPPAPAQIKLSCPKVQAKSTFNMESGGGELLITGAINAVGKLSDAKTVPASTVPGA